MLKHLDLFAGIGGFSYGLEATGGFSTGAFVEINPFCQQILRKHWPSVPVYSDIIKVSVRRGDFDIFTGGFPCQDVSIAGQWHGGAESILGVRSGLWNHYLRLIEEAHPTWIIIENVENLRNKGLGIVLSQIAALGYDAEWHVIRAADVGLPHLRARIWITCHAQCDRLQGSPPFPLRGLRDIAWRENGRKAENWADRGHFTPSPLLRAGHGIPDYVDRIKALGNSIVPQIAYIIGLAILEYYNEP